VVTYNLRKEGFDTATAFNVEEAIRMITEESSGMIILELMLPGYPG